MKILVTGADGQLGSEFRHIAYGYPQHNFIFTSRTSLDITSEESVEKCFVTHRPDLLINCAAYTNVDKAEQDIEAAKKINEYAPSILAKYSDECKSILVHLSSDYVYHNEVKQPMIESDPVHPKGIYAISKLAGEKNILELNSRSVIIRTSWVYSSFGKNFVKTMIKLGQQKDELVIVNDQMGTPTYARDIAETILEIIPKVAKQDFNGFGIYNYSSLGETNWMEFAKKIFELENIKCKVYPTTTLEYGAPADRPLWSVLSKEKIKSVFSINIPHWEDSLIKCLEELK